MTPRNELLTRSLRAYLDRRTMPRGFEGRPESQQREITALMFTINRFAPSTGYAEWWEQLEIRLAEDAQTRAWPTQGEVKKAASAIRGNVTKTVAEGTEFNPLEIIGKRMTAGEPVGDGYIYGRLAEDLLEGGHVSRETLKRYRSAHFFHLRETYGAEQAAVIEAGLLKRQSDAETLCKEHRKQVSAKVPAPKKMTTYEWDGAE